MTTQRAVVFLLVVGGLALFAMQNASPWLPLVLFGIRTQPLPLSFWMVGAIALGVITTLLMVGLINLTGPDFRTRSPRKGRSRTSSYSRESAYQTTPDSEPNWRRPQDKSRETAGSASAARSGGTEPLTPEDWGTFKPPEQWDDWGQRPEPSVAADGPNSATSNRKKSNRPSRREEEQYAVEESYGELAEGWDDYAEPAYEEPAYARRGGSPIDDALDDIADGWDDYDEPYDEVEEKSPPPPPKDYEAQQSPKTVYRSGSLYSYSYDKPASSQANQNENDDFADESDEIEDELDERNDLEEEDYSPPSQANADSRPPSSGPGPGRVGPDGVYEADYRVIIPPIRNLEEEDDWEERENR